VRDAQSRVTILLTTSPCVAHPETTLIEEVVASIAAKGGLSTAVGCRLIIVCDGVKRRDENKFRSGVVNEVGKRRYEEYLDRLAWLANESDGPIRGAELIRLEERHGFGHALKRALMRVTTPYVLVAQHDRAFTRKVPMNVVLDIMDHDLEVSYCGFPTSTTLSHDIRVVGRVFGRNGTKICPTRRSYPSHPGIELVPLLQFYDSMHVARTSFFLEKVFGKRRFINISIGSFIEDQLSQLMLSLIRDQGIEAHAQFGTFIIEDEVNIPMAGHIDGHDPRNTAPESTKFAHVTSSAEDWRSRPNVHGLGDSIERLDGFGHFTERFRYLERLRL